MKQCKYALGRRRHAPALQKVALFYAYMHVKRGRERRVVEGPVFFLGVISAISANEGRNSQFKLEKADDDNVGGRQTWNNLALTDRTSNNVAWKGICSRRAGRQISAGPILPLLACTLHTMVPLRILYGALPAQTLLSLHEHPLI